METSKEIVYIIEYKTPVEDAGNISECLDKMREYGSAIIIDVKVTGGAEAPKCKCGEPCAYYGEVGGYSKACVECNSHKAMLSRKSRARDKRTK
jgi:hypothetical protein